MDFKKIKAFCTLQDAIYESSGGEIPLITYLDGKSDVAIHNIFYDPTGRFEVDPIKTYGPGAVRLMEEEIGKIEKVLGTEIETVEAHELYSFLAGKYYQKQEMKPEWFDIISFEDEVIRMKSSEESRVNDTLNFYVPLNKGFEKLIPEGVLELVCPLDDDKQLNLYANYNIGEHKITLEWICNGENGSIDVPKEAMEGILQKMNSHLLSYEGQDIKGVLEETYDEIKNILKETVESKFYANTDEKGLHHITLYADYRDNNEFLLETAYENRESVDLKNTLLEQLYEAHQEGIFEVEDEILTKAGFNYGDPFYEEAKDFILEIVHISPDCSHFMGDNMKINLLLATDEERNVEFTDIKENLYRQVDKDSYAEMLEDSKKWGNEIKEPDNALMWLIKQQGYTLDDLKKVYEEYMDYFYEDNSPKPEMLDQEPWDAFKSSHSRFLSSICEELDNLRYSMGCLTVLVNSSLDEYCNLFERDSETRELLPKDIIISKDAYLGIFDPWNGAGSLLDIELEKDLILPNSLIFDSQIEGVKPDYTYTVDSVYGLVGGCWIESKGIQEHEAPELNNSLDAKLKNAAKRVHNTDKNINKSIDMEHYN